MVNYLSQGTMSKEAVECIYPDPNYWIDNGFRLLNKNIKGARTSILQLRGAISLICFIYSIARSTLAIASSILAFFRRHASQSPCFEQTLTSDPTTSLS